MFWRQQTEYEEESRQGNEDIRQGAMKITEYWRYTMKYNEQNRHSSEDIRLVITNTANRIMKESDLVFKDCRYDNENDRLDIMKIADRIKRQQTI